MDHVFRDRHDAGRLLADRLAVYADRSDVVVLALPRGAVPALRQRRPARIVIAVPTAAPETCEELKAEVDEMVCATTPTPFYGVGQWYDYFSQTTDEQVRELLEQAAPSERKK